MKFENSDHFDKDHLLSEMDQVTPPHKLMTLCTLLPPLNMLTLLAA